MSACGFWVLFIVISSMSKPDFLNQRMAVAWALFGRVILPWKVMALLSSFLGKVGWVSFVKVVMMPWSVVLGLQLVIFWAMVSQF